MLHEQSKSTKSVPGVTNVIPNDKVSPKVLDDPDHAPLHESDSPCEPTSESPSPDDILDEMFQEDCRRIEDELQNQIDEEIDRQLQQQMDENLNRAFEAYENEMEKTLEAELAKELESSLSIVTSSETTIAPAVNQVDLKIREIVDRYLSQELETDGWLYSSS